MRMTILGALLSVLSTVGLAQSQEATSIRDEHVNVLACLENMEASTTWEQCVGLIFAPCSAYEVGGEDHVACLQRERVQWNKSMQSLQADVQAAITLNSSNDLGQILSVWINYVAQKCNAAGEANAETSANAAQLGCQITELVGLTSEYAACLEGRSTAEFCVLKP